MLTVHEAATASGARIQCGGLGSSIYAVVIVEERRVMADREWCKATKFILLVR